MPGSSSPLGRRDFLQAAGGAVLLQPRVDGAPPSIDWDSQHGSITDVRGMRVGHYTEPARPTGCTVLLFDEPVVAGVDVRGSAPGSRETDLLNPVNTVDRINALVLSGGSAFGLDAASGVMRFLEERGVGYRVGNAVVPIVPAAILFDLQIGDPKIHPTANSGYAACQAASHSNVIEGNFGAGAGATVGKLFGTELAMKSGIGTASWTVEATGLVVGALVAVNAVGDVVSKAGKIIAGARHPDGTGFLDCMAQFMAGVYPGAKFGANTTIGVVATNAQLSKVEATKVAQMAHDGLARAISPVHTAYDGDTIFAVADGKSQNRHEVTVVGAIAAEVVRHAVVRAALTATGIPDLPSHNDLTWAR